MKILEYEDQICKLQIWDTVGNERFRPITSAYFRGCHGIFLLYDITNKDSFADVENWLNEAQKYAPENVSVILLGHKSDLEDRRAISYDVGYQYARSHEFSFFEVSAKTNSNIDEALVEMISQIKKIGEKNAVKIKDTPIVKTLGEIKQANSTSNIGACCSMIVLEFFWHFHFRIFEDPIILTKKLIGISYATNWNAIWHA